MLYPYIYADYELLDWELQALVQANPYLLISNVVPDAVTAKKVWLKPLLGTYFEIYAKVQR
jgi:hypothetical protein